MPSAYLFNDFDPVSQTWQVNAIPTPIRSGGFGVAIGIEDAEILIGAVSGDGSDGNVFAFSDDMGLEFFTQLAPRPFQQRGGRFGRALSVSGYTAAVGTFVGGGRQSTGSVVVFRYDQLSGEWLEEGHLGSFRGRNTVDDFGRSVSLDGPLLAVGAPWSEQTERSRNEGSVFVFEYDQRRSRWKTNPIEVRATPVHREQSHFGWSVSLAGDTLVVGAPSRDGRGSVFVFERRSSRRWRQVAELNLGAEANTEDGFGWSVSIDPTAQTIVVGAPFVDYVENDLSFRDSGSAYVYKRSGGNEGLWELEERIVPVLDGVEFGDSSVENAQLGFSVDVDDNLIVAGAPALDGTGGAFVSFRLPLDQDGDGVPDVDDRCPTSILDPTVTIGDCDSGVANGMANDYGCSLADLIANCAEDARNHGEFVRCVADLVNRLRRSGVISNRERTDILRCAARSSGDDGETVSLYSVDVVSGQFVRIEVNLGRPGLELTQLGASNVDWVDRPLTLAWHPQDGGHFFAANPAGDAASSGWELFGFDDETFEQTYGGELMASELSAFPSALDGIASYRGQLRIAHGDGTDGDVVADSLSSASPESYFLDDTLIASALSGPLRDMDAIVNFEHLLIGVNRLDDESVIDVAHRPDDVETPLITPVIVKRSVSDIAVVGRRLFALTYSERTAVNRLLVIDPVLGAIEQEFVLRGFRSLRGLASRADESGLNDPPTDLILEPNSIDENQLPGSIVGSLVTVDGDIGDVHSYSLVSGVGDGDNAEFTVAGAQVLTVSSFDFETKSSFSVRIQTVDKAGNVFQKSLAISVNDLDEASPEIALRQEGVGLANGASFDFGALTVDTVLDVAFTIDNIGDADLVLTGSSLVEIVGGDRDDFSVVQQPSSPIAAGDSAEFIVRFAPLASGSKTAELSIQSNDAENAVFAISLTGDAESVVNRFPFQDIGEADSGDWAFAALGGALTFGHSVEEASYGVLGQAGSHENTMTLSFPPNAVIDLTSAVHPILRFEELYTAGNHVTRSVEVSVDGETWDVLGAEGEFGVNSGTWIRNQKLTFDLGGYLHATNLRIRFRFTGSGGNTSWRIREIEIRESEAIESIAIGVPLYDQDWELETFEQRDSDSQQWVPVTGWFYEPSSGVFTFENDDNTRSATVFLTLAKALDLTAATDPVLTFEETQTSGNPITRTVEVSVDGETWDTLRSEGTFGQHSPVWIRNQKVVVDLSGYIGFSNLRVRFGVSGLGNTSWKLRDLSAQERIPVESISLETALGIADWELETFEEFDHVAQAWEQVVGWSYDDAAGVFSYDNDDNIKSAPVYLKLMKSLDLTTAMEPVLRFEETQTSGNPITRTVQVSTDGATWDVLRSEGVFGQHSRAWIRNQKIVVDLSDYIGTPGLRIRFGVTGMGGTSWRLREIELGERMELERIPFGSELPDAYWGLETFDEFNPLTQQWEELVGWLFHANSGVFVFDNFDNTKSAPVYLNLTRVLDLTLASNPILQFEETQTSGNPITRIVQVSVDGETWDTLRSEGTFGQHSPAWIRNQKIIVDLSPYVGVTDLRLRFGVSGFGGTSWRLREIETLEKVALENVVLGTPILADDWSLETFDEFNAEAEEWEPVVGWFYDQSADSFVYGNTDNQKSANVHITLNKTLDMRNSANPEIAFEETYVMGNNASRRVQASIDGQTWDTLRSEGVFGQNQPEFQSVTIPLGIYSDVAALFLRFQMTGGANTGWTIRNLSIGDACDDVTTTYHWVGASSSEWNARGNWMPEGVPCTGDNVVIDVEGRGAPNSPILVASGVMIHDLTFFSGALDLAGNELAVTGAVSVSGGSIRNGALTINSADNSAFANASIDADINGSLEGLSIQGSVFDSSVQFSASSVSIADSVFRESASFSKTGPGENNSSNNTFESDLQLSNSSASGLHFCFSGNSSYNGNLIVESTGTGGITFGTGGGISTLADGKTIAKGPAGFDVGTLRLTGFMQVGTAAQELLLSPGSLAINASNWGGSVTFGGSKMSAWDTVFHGPVWLSKTGPGEDNSANNTFASELRASNSSASGLHFCFSGNSSYNGNLIVESTGTGGITFGTGGGISTLADGKTIAKGPAGFDVGTLRLTGFMQVGTAAQELLLSPGSLAINASNWEGSVTFGGSKISAWDTVFHGPAWLSKTGPGEDNSANNTFASELRASNSSASGLHFCFSGNSSYNGNLIVESTGTGGITFGTGGGISTLADGKTIAKGPAGFDVGTLRLTGFMQVGTAAQELLLSPGSLAINASNWGGSVTFSGSKMSAWDTVFHGPAWLSKTGPGEDYNSNNVFESDLRASNSSASGFHLCYSGSSYYNGNLMVESTGTGGMSFGVGGGISTLADGKTIAKGPARFDVGTLTIRGFTQVGTTSQVLAISPGSLVLDTSNWGGNVSFDGSGMTAVDSVFNGAVSITKTGLGENYNSNNTFEDDLHIRHANVHGFHFSYQGNSTFNGNVVVENTGGGDIRFGSAGGVSTLADGKTVRVGPAGFVGGNLVLRGFTQLGATPQILSVSPGSLVLDTTNWGGDVSFDGSGMTAVDSVFNGSAALVKSGSGENYSSNNTFEDDLHIRHANVHGLHFSYQGNSTFNGNIVVENTGGGDIQFGFAGGLSTLADGKTIEEGPAGFVGGNLVLRGFTQLGTTPQHLSVSPGALVLDASDWGGDVSFDGSGMTAVGSVFHGSAVFVKTGSGENYNSNNTFEGDLHVRHTSIHQFHFAFQGNSIYRGDVLVENTGGGVIQFGAAGGIVELGGSGDQTLGGSPTLQINQLDLSSGAGIVTLLQDLDVTNLELNDRILDLNGFSLTVLNSSVDAIGANSGFVRSESVDGSGRVVWVIGSATGGHVIPFGTSGGGRIPIRLEVMSGNLGSVSVSTYGTAPDNTPLPISVANIENTGGTSDGANVVDRFWQIEPTGSGVLAGTFSYPDAEASVDVVEMNLLAQGYDAGVNQWYPAQAGQLADSTLNTVTVPNVGGLPVWCLSSAQ